MADTAIPLWAFVVSGGDRLRLAAAIAANFTGGTGRGSTMRKRHPCEAGTKRPRIVRASTIALCRDAGRQIAGAGKQVRQAVGDQAAVAEG
jgi:ribosomal protein S14